ncbi:hypothetical protein OOT00_09500 [Desulfobotulus sp. H1]|uniref:Uncharacterized protein n=1 Tax=Desulfobotulus pelophilus TaxID=2823377 RepID=A0ABT3N9T2_9BACT|nr:hypothetical protein [Desulfobotulus pelophilus]MCW7754221.1 hypothetical protein [Desulfobotulus pelophilus]
MSTSQVGFISVGDFTEKILVRMFGEESPGGLPMVFEDPRKIAINHITAMETGCDAPVDILVLRMGFFRNFLVFLKQMYPSGPSDTVTVCSHRWCGFSMRMPDILTSTFHSAVAAL